MAKIWMNLRQHSLYLNSLYLMTSTAVMAIFGFVYWVVAARLYSSADVGMAATLISITTYISLISQFGINAGIMRFLPISKDKTVKINTSLTFVIIISIPVSLIFAFGARNLSAELVFISGSIISLIVYAVFMMFAALNVTLESVLIATHNSVAVLLKNTILSSLKIVFLLLFVAFGANGLFASWTVAVVVAMIITLIIFAVSTGFKLQLCFKYTYIREMAGYSIGNYVGSMIASLPQYLLPLLLTIMIGPMMAAHFNVAMSFAALLYSIPVSICNVLLVEGATDEARIWKSAQNAIKLNVLILIPAVVMLLVFRETALSLFGIEYAKNSAPLFSMLVISSIFVAINTLSWTILNLQQRIKEILGVLTASTIIVMILCWVFMSNKLNGIGTAWLMGQGLTSMIYIVLLLKPRYLTYLSLQRHQ